MANEQTSVPLYAASEILTAANMNISAGTGVPVFATTVTRDAAFGGAGEKVLAEGQLCYLSSTNVVQQYNGASWTSVGSQNLVQIVNSQTGASSTGTTRLPFDNTIPQITEGTQFLSLAITPTSATNALVITVNINAAVNAVDVIGVALFQDSTANALAATGEYGSTANGLVNSQIIYKMTSGTTSATTFRVRLGPDGANTLTFNGSGGTGLYGGVCISSITIVEYAV